MPPSLRERKAPDSSHITLWWQSEEHLDSWDSELATFSGQAPPPHNSLHPDPKNVLSCGDHWVLTPSYLLSSSVEGRYPQ